MNGFVVTVDVMVAKIVVVTMVVVAVVIAMWMMVVMAVVMSVIVAVVVAMVVAVVVVVVSAGVVEVVLLGNFLSVLGDVFSTHSNKLARTIIGGVIWPDSKRGD